MLGPSRLPLYRVNRQVGKSVKSFTGQLRLETLIFSGQLQLCSQDAQMTGQGMLATGDK